MKVIFVQANMYPVIKIIFENPPTIFIGCMEVRESISNKNYMWKSNTKNCVLLADGY